MPDVVPVDDEVSQWTRGRTAPNRLRRLDVFLLRTERRLITRTDPPFGDAPVVDVGIGRAPWTTRETWQRLRCHAPALEVMGVDIDPHRVAAAQSYAADGLSFCEGGLAPPTRARLVRVMNVLRDYPPSDVRAAYGLLTGGLVEGGLLVEGSCDRFGRVLAVELTRGTASGGRSEGLLISTNFRAGFHPRMFRRYYPRAYRGRPAELETVIDAWEKAWLSCGGRTARERFVRSTSELARMVPGISRDPWLREHGFLRWRP